VCLRFADLAAKEERDDMTARLAGRSSSSRLVLFGVRHQPTLKADKVSVPSMGPPGGASISQADGAVVFAQGAHVDHAQQTVGLRVPSSDARHRPVELWDRLEAGT